MIVTCRRHGIELNTPVYCEQCLDERRLVFEASMQPGVTYFTSYDGTPKEGVMIDGQVCAPEHASACLEQYIPADLEAEISAFIDEAVAAYQERCLCAMCQVERLPSRD